MTKGIYNSVFGVIREIISLFLFQRNSGVNVDNLATKNSLSSIDLPGYLPGITQYDATVSFLTCTINCISALCFIIHFRKC